MSSSIVGCGKNDQSTSDASATESVDKRDKPNRREGRKKIFICEVQFEDLGITRTFKAGSKANATSQALRACSLHQNCRVTACYYNFL
jgi:hypothetical protein